jgi:very-short-patch-repair endonuclease
MRRAPTPSEARLWSALRARQLGVQFRRQVVIGRCIVDFLAAEVRLVVEVDGGSHWGRERADARRDRRLRAAGYRVVRVSAELVMRDLQAAVACVGAAFA